jgi:hypothetical protein
MRQLIFAPLLLLAGCATAGSQRLAGETAIPFIASTEVVEWRVRDERSLYVHGITNQWYLVTTMGSCGRLRTANTLGFVTARGTDDLDRHGAILAEGQRCQIESVTRSEAPPADLVGGARPANSAAQGR